MSKEEGKYGVSHFAKEAGIEEASARVLLRKAGIKKNGRTYNWASMADVKKAVDKARSASPARDDKPAKKPKAKARAKAKPRSKSSEGAEANA